MDNYLLVLMPTACFCGSIKNSRNLPPPFEGRHAKAIGDNGQQYNVPYNAFYYPSIGVDSDAPSNSKAKADESNDFGSDHPFDANWCKEAHPDCSKDFTIENCKGYCESRHGRAIHRIRIPLSDLSLQMVGDETFLRYSGELQKIDWVEVFDKELSFISYHRQKAALHICGQFSISPLIMLGKLIQDQRKTTSYDMQSDEEFRFSSKSFANTLSLSEQEFDDEKKKLGRNALRYALRSTFRNNEESIRDFLTICDEISKRYNIPAVTSTTNPAHRQNIVKRTENEEIKLKLPFARTECWQLSATHFGAQETESSAVTNGKMSAIDMSPFLFQKWGIPFDFVNSIGEVYAAHSGYFKKHSTPKRI